MDDIVTISRWFDRHHHIRDWETMRRVLPHLLQQRPSGAIIMPNLADPITNSERARSYLERIRGLIPPDSDFVPCLALYLTDETTPKEVVDGYNEGLWKAVKLYLADQNGQGGTTGSHYGVRNLHGRYRVFEAMEKHHIPLLGHWEAAEYEVDEFDRELVSLDRDLIPARRVFPALPIGVEHLTNSETADFVALDQADHPTYATVTAHHLMMSRNAMFWGGMNPDHYCRPVAKREEHRLKIRRYVTSGHPRFGAGTDSAPHDESAKARCYNCAAGIFTAPLAVELYATVFDQDGKLENLDAFLSQNFLHIYGMEVSKEMMTIKREPWIVPKTLHGIPVFMGGQEIPWKLSS